jgi:hypothetical protein
MTAAATASGRWSVSAYRSGLAVLAEADGPSVEEAFVAEQCERKTLIEDEEVCRHGLRGRRYRSDQNSGALTAPTPLAPV